MNVVNRIEATLSTKEVDETQELSTEIDVYFCRAAGDVKTFTLPPAKTSKGKKITCICDYEDHYATVVAGGSDAIFGFADSVNLNSIGDYVTVISDGIERWYCVGIKLT